jgi:hypothetical protein
MSTRSSVIKLKQMQTSLRDLCTGLIGRSETIDPTKDVDQAAAVYVKLNEYRCKLRGMDKELFELSSSSPKDFTESEEFDFECLKTSEKLYLMLSSDHPLRTKSQIPVHLSQAAVTGGGDHSERPASTGNKSAFEKLKLETFDGKSQTWLLWKSVFESEVHMNEKLSSNHKFLLLVSNLKKGSFAHKLAVAYVGINDGYDLAWKDLQDHYESTTDLEATHLIALRDLHRTSKVYDSNNLRQLESLRHAAWSNVNALKALKATPASYESLAVLGVKGCLPHDLRKKFFLENRSEAEAHSSLEAMFKFLQDECKALRKTWEFRPERNGPRRELVSRKEVDKTIPKLTKSEDTSSKKTFKRNRFSKTRKYSSMFQDEIPDEEAQSQYTDLNY